MKATLFSLCIGIHFRKIRQERQKNLQYVAYKSGLSKEYIVAIENGKVDITIYELYQLADGIGVHPFELADNFRGT